MQTDFSAAALEDPNIATCNDILRKCVHCGFCTATCPTYVLLGDELDSPRGRIYLIKEMLENDRAADEKTVHHVDRCLSCLSCMTTCPSGVDYMHLVDHARAHIARTYRRPLGDRLLRMILALVLPRPLLFRLSLLGAKIASPFAALLPDSVLSPRLKGLIKMAPAVIPPPSPVDRPQVHKARHDGPRPKNEIEGLNLASDGVGPTGRRRRVALLNGCAQKALDPKINEATIRLLNRHGVDVVVAKGAGCCGALTHHMGDETSSHASARRNIDAWCDEMNRDGLDAVISNTSGCGTTVKDYGFMFRNDPAMAQKAAEISGLARDITEFMSEIGLANCAPLPRLKVAYHSACSMQHGQKVTAAPVDLLQEAGFDVQGVPESHLCCGSAGTYNLLQPDIATRLQARKVANIESTGADLVAAGNLGCMIQISGGTKLPVVHTVELLDWATGGPRPEALETLESLRGGPRGNGEGSSQPA